MSETIEERLENMSPFGMNQDGNFLVKQEDYFWLSEQVQELENRIQNKTIPEIEKVYQQNTFINGKRLCKAYGNFFLWKEMMLKSKDSKIKETVFITNDQREDWDYEAKGKKIGARIELVEEIVRGELKEGVRPSDQTPPKAPIHTRNK